MVPQTEENRLFVVRELEKGTDPDAIAAALVQTLARQYVDMVKRREDGNHYRQQVGQSKPFHIFGVEAGNSTPELPTYDQYRIYETDRPAFAKWVGLKESDLLRISRGEVEQVGKVRQGMRHGPLDQPYKPKSKKRGLPEWDISGMNEKHLDGPFIAVYPYTDHKSADPAPALRFTPPQNWTPPDA